MKTFLLHILLCIGLGIVGVGTRFLGNKKINQTDNQIEEFVEDIIERQTGIKLDISPDNNFDKDFDRFVLLEEVLEPFDIQASLDKDSK